MDRRPLQRREVVLEEGPLEVRHVMQRPSLIRNLPSTNGSGRVDGVLMSTTNSYRQRHVEGSQHSSPG